MFASQTVVERATHFLHFWEPWCLNSTSDVCWTYGRVHNLMSTLSPTINQITKSMNSVAICRNLLHVPCPKAKVSMVTVRRERTWKMPTLRHCGLNLDLFVSETKMSWCLSDTTDLLTLSQSTTHTLHSIVCYLLNLHKFTISNIFLKVTLKFFWLWKMAWRQDLLFSIYMVGGWVRTAN